MNNPQKPYTLITGASHGIGKEFARECARHGWNLALVALPGPELEEVRMEIAAEFGVETRAFGVDLTTDDGAERVYQWVKSEGLAIDKLINNAGIGTGGMFDAVEPATYRAMIKLNNLALAELTRYFVPEIKKQGRGYILNMSSMEAALPLPYKAVYTGTKNFTYYLSLALHEELKADNISVTVVCPGPVPTNPETMKRFISQGWKAKLVGLLPEEVAKKGIRAMLKRRRVYVPGLMNRFARFVAAVFPLPLKMPLLERIFRAYRHHEALKMPGGDEE